MPTAGNEYPDPHVNRGVDAPAPGRGIAPSALFATAALLALVFLAIANFNGEGNGGTGPYIVTVAITLVVAAALLFWQWHRFTDRPEHWSLILGIAAIVTCVVFWSGLPFAFGVTAAGLGLLRTSETRAKIGIALGGLAVLATILACFFG